MTTLDPGSAPLSPAATVEGVVDWVEALSMPGPRQDDAHRQLHALMLRAARRQVQRMQPVLNGVGTQLVEEIANQAADEAMMTLLGKLGTFEGRSRFTTWAYKFAVLQAATAVRSVAWRDRDVHLDGLDLLAGDDPQPGQYAEASDLADAVRSALDSELSPHQRRIMVALVVDDVPIDVLAERLGTTRNALYKALHDARKRLRAHLRRTGHLDDIDTQAGIR
ncbi:MAG TPA: sigma-70 family RNA polymerase sigma factor [Marmoricola sp.]|nr:sigma-70 family RNA polymerase sigma factor [Marmoricola sp.]